MKFSQTYPIVLLSRSSSSYKPIVDEIKAAGGQAIGVDTDVTDSASVAKAFEAIQKEMGDAKLAAAVYNVGGGFVRKPFLELSEKEFKAGWDSNGYVDDDDDDENEPQADHALCRLGLYNFAHQTIPLLLSSVPGAQHPPSLIITGATASIKGSALCGSFAAGKFAMRALSQSLAREFGPKGVHVAHAIIDGGIDTPWGKDMVFNGGAEDGKISPDGIADAYWHLHTQPRTTFTHEIDIRPYIEKW
jgi:NAD(P)-dependent dehydrogenase (short-subunit alcohol dehydrogenase family)